MEARVSGRKFRKQAGRYDGDFADLAKVIRGEKRSPSTPEQRPRRAGDSAARERLSV